MVWDYLDEGDELEDREYPDEPHDDSWDEDDVTVRCPDCGADVYEDALQCPECGWYVTATARTELPKHWKIVAVVVLVVFGWGILSALL